MHGGVDERGLAEQLRYDDRDEIGLAVRKSPDVLEHGVERLVFLGKHLEMGLAARPREEAGPDPWVAARERDVDRTQLVRIDSLRVPQRFPRRSIEALDVEDDRVDRLPS